MSYKFIAIEGNIGAGKTTVARLLAEQLGGQLLLESFADNPYLERFYRDPERYALPTELWFLQERARQMAGLNVKNGFLVSDYTLFKGKIFAKETLRDESYNLYENLNTLLTQNLPVPDVIVLLNRSVPMLKKQIEGRGRDFESGIDTRYLSRIGKRYEDFFSGFKSSYLLNIDADRYDFVENEFDANYLMNLILQRIKPELI